MRPSDFRTIHSVGADSGAMFPVVFFSGGACVSWGDVLMSWDIRHPVIH